MSDFRKLLNIVEELSEQENVELHDSFDIEISEDFVIETGVIGFTKDGIILEADEKAFKLLTSRKLLSEAPNRFRPSTNPHHYDSEQDYYDAVDDAEAWDRAQDSDEADAYYADRADDEKFYQQADLDDMYREGMVMGSGSDASSAGSFLQGESKEMDEAKYQGREVPLNKPMRGDVAKSKVYVKGPKGNVVKVNFGDKTMRIKKNSPSHRKSFRARHRCETPGPKWKARYWSCKMW
jgi:hypothetical protein